MLFRSDATVFVLDAEGKLQTARSPDSLGPVVRFGSPALCVKDIRDSGVVSRTEHDEQLERLSAPRLRALPQRSEDRRSGEEGRYWWEPDY